VIIVDPFKDIVNTIRRISTDTDGVMWDNQELTDYLNEGQREFCRLTRTLRAETPLLYRENFEIYTLPNNCYEITRIELADGTVLCKSSSNDLARRFGSRYREATGTPSFYYHDLDGEGQIRFYPKANANLCSQYTAFNTEPGAVSQVQDDLGVNIAFDSEEGVVADYESDEYDMFDFEEGAVTASVSTDSAVRVFYICYPRKDYMEISDELALRYYTLARCLEKDSPLQDLKKSVFYDTKFDHRVNIQRGRMQSAFGAELAVKGHYL